ncbi:MAG: hypothetical protein ACRDIF_07100, partial [Actinomycetota bacterium]
SQLPAPGPGSDKPAGGPPRPGPPGPDRPQVVRPRPGMINVRPVGWERAEMSQDGRSARILFWSGVEPCNVLDHVEVVYSPERVAVTLFEGTDPRGVDQVCIEIALLKATDVALKEPLGGRPLVDGSKVK